MRSKGWWRNRGGEAEGIHLLPPECFLSACPASNPAPKDPGDDETPPTQLQPRVLFPGSSWCHLLPTELRPAPGSDAQRWGWAGATARAPQSPELSPISALAVPQKPCWDPSLSLGLVVYFSQFRPERWNIKIRENTEKSLKIDQSCSHSFHCSSYINQ